MVRTVVSLAHNDVEMRLPLLTRNFDAFFQHIFCFFNKQAVQVDSVTCHAPHGIVLAENIVACLTIVLFHFCGMLLALLRQFVGASPVAGFVGLMRAIEA